MFLEQFVKTKVDLNFRSGAVVGNNIIRTLKAGTVVQVLSPASNGWYRAELSDGTVGYISNKADYVAEYVPAWLATARKVALLGEKYLSVPYEWGSDRGDDTTFDCSDFQKWIFGKNGIVLDWTSRSQADDGPDVSLNNLRSGDLIFFAKSDGYIYHVSQYVNIDGKDRLLHTFNTHADIFDRNLNKVKSGCGGVTFSDFSIGSYWRTRAYKANRVINGATFV